MSPHPSGPARFRATRNGREGQLRPETAEPDLARGRRKSDPSFSGLPVLPQFYPSSISPSAPGIEVNVWHMRFSLHANALQEIHQIGAVIRSGEIRPGDTTSGPLRAGASVQPFPHNPRKQREIPADAKRRETFREGQWRRRRDSNPRNALALNGFQDRRIRPLCHSSAAIPLRIRAW